MTRKILSGIVLLIIVACAPRYFRSNYNTANELLYSEAQTGHLYMKAHFRNGDIGIFYGQWEVDTTKDELRGRGELYDFNRKKINHGALAFSLDSIMLFETNKSLTGSESTRIGAVTLLVVTEVLIAAYCALNPKACFGSCPTFYFNPNDNFHYADAEGFSSAVSPTLEYTDIDALPPQIIRDKKLSLSMKNEAQETHCIDELKLLAFPIKAAERVYQTPADEFYSCRTLPLKNANAAEGDITALLKQEDYTERFSKADEKNLNSKEEIILDFENPGTTENIGLVLHFRQTLMSTYFFYNAIGYMGNEASERLAEFERKAETKQKLEGGIKKALGGIKVYCWNTQRNTWEFCDETYETGPIALNKQLLRLRSNGSNCKLKLELNKGLWRIDYVALALIDKAVTPAEIKPVKVWNKGRPDTAAQRQLSGAGEYLISMPGNHYTIDFELPETGRYELFLSSKGYYLEWLRQNWMKDKNTYRLWQMLYAPAQYLKAVAKDFKQYESTMEQEFWNSKIDTKTHSYYEN